MTTTLPIPETNLWGRPPDSKTSIPGRKVFPQDPAKSGLVSGCYKLEILPEQTTEAYTWSLNGTLRIEVNANNDEIVASGDLYLLLYPMTDELGLLPYWEGYPSLRAEKVPIFDRDQYAYYVAVTQLEDWSKSDGQVRLGFDLLHLLRDEAQWLPRDSSGPYWTDLVLGPVTLDPHPNASFAGSLYGPEGDTVGRLSLRWVSPFYRKARIEIQRAPTCPPVDSVKVPNSGDEISVQSALEAAGFEVEVFEEEIAVCNPPGNAWDLASLHRTMLGWRSQWDLDAQWTYHLLVVPIIDGVVRGIMYDWLATDANEIPREGAALEANDFFSDAAALFGGEPQEIRSAGYLRTAIHELAHAMGLDHNVASNGYMNTSDTILGLGAFWDVVEWSFHADDLWRLRHWPDPVIRPGGLPFDDYSVYDASAQLLAASDQIELTVQPVSASVPLGAPIRLELTLHNKSGEPVLAPELAEGPVWGRVLPPAAGPARSFRPLNRCREGLPMTPLEQDEALEGSLTLFRGRDGALFPSPGRHILDVSVLCRTADGEVVVRAHTAVDVEAPPDAETSERAEALLSQPAVLPLVAGRGGAFPAARRALARAAEGGKLRRHWAYFEALRKAARPEPPLDEIESLLEDAVKTRHEKAREKILRDRLGLDPPPNS